MIAGPPTPALDDIVDRMTYRELLSLVKNKHSSAKVIELDFAQTIEIRWERSLLLTRPEFNLLMAGRNLLGDL